MLLWIFRVGAQKRCLPFISSCYGVPEPRPSLSNKPSPNATTARSLAFSPRISKSLPCSTSNASPTILTHSSSSNTHGFPKRLWTLQTKKAPFHTSRRVDLSAQDLPESLIHFKSVEGFTQGLGLALLASTPYYALYHRLLTKRSWWVVWGSAAIPTAISLGLVAIAMEQCPHSGRWRFFLAGGDDTTDKLEINTEDTKKQDLPSTSMTPDTGSNGFASGDRTEARQEFKIDAEEEQEATTKKIATTMSKQDDLVLDENDPRVLLAERVLDRLLTRAIEAEIDGQLRLKTFLCDLPETPPQIPDKAILDSLKTLVEKSKEDTVTTQKSGRSKRWLQGQKHPFRIHVRNSNEFNAHAFKDNTIIMEDGILQGLAMDEELIAAVVAHELAHLVQQHLRERDSNASLVHILTVAGIATCWPVAFRLGPFITFIVVEGITKGSELLIQRFAFQENEHEADVLAMTILGLAGYDPLNMLAFHLMMAQKEESDVFGLDRVVLSRLGKKSSGTGTPSSTPKSSLSANDLPRPTLAPERAERDAKVEQDPVLAHSRLIKEYLETPLWTRWSSTHPSYMDRKTRCARALCDIRCKWRRSELIKQKEKNEQKAEESRKALGRD